jgi:hypothetical protein
MMLFRRKKLLTMGGGVILVAGLAIAVYASFHAGNSYEKFKHSCLASRGASVVQLSVSTHAQYMGGPATTYTMGCRQPDGSVTATAKTSKP